jgi:hypothetical protein
MKNPEKVVLCCAKPSNREMYYGFFIVTEPDSDFVKNHEGIDHTGSTDSEVLKAVTDYRDHVISLGLTVGKVETKSYDDWKTVILESQNGLPL